MRLLYCSRDYTTHDLRFVRALAGAGIEVFYLRLENDGVPYVAGPLPDGATFVKWAGGGRPVPVPEAVGEYLPSFARVVSELRPNLIHAGPVQSFGLMAALARGAPTVLVSWGSDLLVESTRDAWYKWASRTAVHVCDAFLCDSPAVLDEARSLSHGALVPHLCIPWGPEVASPSVDSEARTAFRRRRGWQDCIVVIATRAWHSGYCVPDLVDAFASASERNPRLRLALLGAGADAPAVLGRIAERGVESRVCRPGVLSVAQMRRFLAASDVYLSLVPSDGTSISLLEAMSYGLPAVVVRNAGNSVWVEDGGSGFLVDPGDAEAWAARLLAIASDGELARRMGDAARETVRRRADWSTNSGRLVEFYRRTAQRASGSVGSS